MELQKLHTETIYAKLRLTYILLFLFALTLRSFSPYSVFVPSRVDSIIFAIIPLFGVGLIVLDLLSEKILLRSKYNIWLFLFLIVYIISCVLNMRYGFVSNAKVFIWLCINFFLLYPVDQKRDSEEVVKELRIIQNALIFVWFLLSCVSILTFVGQWHYEADSTTGVWVRMGYSEARLFGVYGDPNYASIIAILTIIFSVVNCRAASKKSLRAYYVANIVIQYIYIVLAGSRTAIVSGAFVVLLSAIFIISPSLSDKGIKGFKNALCCVLIGVLCTTVMVGSLNISKQLLSYVPSIYSNAERLITKSDRTDYNFTLEKAEIVRDDVANSEDISNLRFKIWRSAMEIFKSNVLFGVTPRNMIKYAKSEMPQTFIAQRNYVVHNAYLDVLVSTGIIGFVIMMIYCGKNLIDLIKYYMLKWNNTNIELNVIVLSLASVCVSALFLSELFFAATIGALIFWVFLGYGAYFVEKKCC